MVQARKGFWSEHLENCANRAREQININALYTKDSSFKNSFIFSNTYLLAQSSKEDRIISHGFSANAFNLSRAAGTQEIEPNTILFWLN